YLRGIGKYNAHTSAIGALLSILKSGARIDDILWQESAEKILDTLVENELSDADMRVASAIYAASDRFYRSEESASYLSEFPGVRDGISALRTKGIRLGIVSNAESWRVRMLLHRIGEPHFDVVLASDTVKEKKPSGVGILQAIRALGAEPKETYYAGDTLKDIQAARNAGCRSVVLLTGHGTREQIEAAKPDLVFESFAEMADHFTKG
ncbi:MAG: HAD family hydrolase, partial [Candidatus Micrarchaeota archaeon]|nr:HAD family hydrolase [Candidatus Micrarchaeota archaeon]